MSLDTDEALSDPPLMVDVEQCLLLDELLLDLFWSSSSSETSMSGVSTKLAVPEV